MWLLCMTDSRIQWFQTDPCVTSDDRNLTDFRCFSPRDKVSDWIADRLVEGPTGNGALGVYYSALVLLLRCHCVNNSKTLMYVGVSMRRYRVKK
jgi:hypothetical protein